ncbi:PAQR family membrane homeostasis protein TrhA [Ekhidna sp.]
MSDVQYSVAEERLNIISHAIGVIASAVALTLMIAIASTPIEIISSLVFGLSLILLYIASTLYHSAKDPLKRSKLRIFDHAAIFILIAGTYTPVCLLTLANSIGNTLLVVIWSIAICGVALKLFYTGKYDRLSTIMYIAMGWVAVFAINPLLNTMSSEGLLWLLAGGIFYTVGAILYSIRSLYMNHAIFHICVLGGSASHFIMIYKYVL